MYDWLLHVFVIDKLNLIHRFIPTVCIFVAARQLKIYTLPVSRSALWVRASDRSELTTLSNIFYLLVPLFKYVNYVNDKTTP